MQFYAVNDIEQTEAKTQMKECVKGSTVVEVLLYVGQNCSNIWHRDPLLCEIALSAPGGKCEMTDSEEE